MWWWGTFPPVLEQPQVIKKPFSLLHLLLPANISFPALQICGFASRKGFVPEKWWKKIFQLPRSPAWACGKWRWETSLWGHIPRNKKIHPGFELAVSYNKAGTLCNKKRSYCCIFLVSQAKMRPFKQSIGFCKKEMVGIETGLYKHQHNRIFYPNYPLSPLVWENMKQFNEVTVMPWFTGKKKKGFNSFHSSTKHFFFIREFAGIVNLE